MSGLAAAGQVGGMAANGRRWPVAVLVAVLVGAGAVVAVGRWRDGVPG